MFCCGGAEEESSGPPANQYAPPRGGNTYGGGGNFAKILLHIFKLHHWLLLFFKGYREKGLRFE